MNVHLQIRNMKSELHRKAKARAALAGMSMSDWAKKVLERELRKPTNAEIAAIVAKLPPVDIGNTSVDFIREDRDSR